MNSESKPTLTYEEDNPQGVLTVIYYDEENPVIVVDTTNEKQTRDKA